MDFTINQIEEACSIFFGGFWTHTCENLFQRLSAVIFRINEPKINNNVYQSNCFKNFCQSAGWEQLAAMISRLKSVIEMCP
jgi:hypothetical protein